MTFGQLQAEEARRFGYPAVHRLVVDAYMAQHPGDGTDRRDRRSVFVHLVDLSDYKRRAAGVGARSLADLGRPARRNPGCTGGGDLTR